MIYDSTWREALLRQMKLIAPSITNVTFTERKWYYKLRKNNMRFKRLVSKELSDPIRRIVRPIEEFNFDFSDKYNCANCIVYALYYYRNEQQRGDVVPINYEMLLMYILFIHRSCEIIGKHLPGFLVRFYVHKNVREILNENDKTGWSVGIYDSIVAMKNVETYTIDTTNDHTHDVERIRAIRLIPLFDPFINVCILKDADSIITSLDINNYSLFSKSNYILYINNALASNPRGCPKENQEHNERNIVPYNETSIYGEYITGNYLPREWILSGMSGVQVTFKEALLESCMGLLNVCFPSESNFAIDEVLLGIICSPILAFPKECDYKEIQKIDNLTCVPTKKVNIYITSSLEEIEETIDNAIIKRTIAHNYDHAYREKKHYKYKKITNQKEFLRNVYFDFSNGESVCLNGLENIRISKLIKCSTLTDIKEWWGTCHAIAREPHLW